MFTPSSQDTISHHVKMVLRRLKSYLSLGLSYIPAMTPDIPNWMFPKWTNSKLTSTAKQLREKTLGPAVAQKKEGRPLTTSVWFDPRLLQSMSPRVNDV